MATYRGTATPRQREVMSRPLRAVVSSYLNEHGVVIERLECGHEQHQKHDHMGPTNAYRRRCRFCARTEQIAPEVK